MVAGQVQYITGSNGQQQMVILPMAQPIAGGSHIPASNGPSMTTVMPGQQIVITNPTSAGQTVYVQPSKSPRFTQMQLVEKRIEYGQDLNALNSFGQTRSLRVFRSCRHVSQVVSRSHTPGVSRLLELKFKRT